MAQRASQRSHTVVLGTDFSPGSRLAQARAAQVALRRGATLHVVHAASRLPRALLERFSSVKVGKLREALDALVEELRASGIDAHAHLMHADPVDALTRQARAVDADLVIVGTRGGSALDAMLGSTAERLISAASHRVLLVRRSLARYRKIVIAASEESRLREQFAAAAFISSRPPSVLHAFEAPFESALMLHGASAYEVGRYRATARREAEARMRAALEKAGFEGTKLVLSPGNPFRLLERFDADSLLVLSRGRSRTRHLLFGSVTRAVVAYGRCDVLLV